MFSLAAGRAKATPAERAATIAVNTSPWLVDALPDRCRTVVRLGSSTEYAASPRPLAEDAALEPRGFFGATKAAGSLLLQAAAAERGVRAAVLRAFQVYGPGDHPTRLVPVVLEAARTGTAVPLPARLSRRDWVWVGDVVDACVRAAVDDALPAGRGAQHRHRRADQHRGAGRHRRARHRPADRHRARRAPRPRHWDTADWVCDPTAARTLLGWKPTVDLAEGLARTWAALMTGRVAVVVPVYGNAGTLRPLVGAARPPRWPAGTGGCGSSSTPRRTTAPPWPHSSPPRTSGSPSPCWP